MKGRDCSPPLGFEAAHASIPRTSTAIAETLRTASERLRKSGVRPDIMALDHSSLFPSRMSAYLVDYFAGEKGAADRWVVSDLERLLQTDLQEILGLS